MLLVVKEKVLNISLKYFDYVFYTLLFCSCRITMSTRRYSCCTCIRYISTWNIIYTLHTYITWVLSQSSNSLIKSMIMVLYSIILELTDRLFLD